ncbi:hypothetical protein PVK37_24760 [Micromonospora cathayae]|uniref:HTH araC/xylS-type domain-containing protein n=1 Tax=Micromonospora cathayae TaxID=3028804 RepID=A0ABY7ZNL1_9ACTN|nr:hypothetical protein [Micromonospora sp. HUAS 3]WDZ83648.1 hypothetical protein PVK37_24760 [Micromonospora sp. HUAS 3]
MIARRYGFTSPAHFSRLFARTYGQPPHDDRRTGQERAIVHGMQ